MCVWGEYACVCVQIVCDSQAAFDLKKGMLAFVYNMYIQACASNGLICFDREYISCFFFFSFILLRVTELVFILRKEKDFKVK